MTSYLITWKPQSENPKKGWPEAALAQLAESCEKNCRAREPWRFQRFKGVTKGERVFLLQQGKRGHAILGYGTIARPSTSEDRTAEIQFDALLDPRKHLCFVAKHELHRISSNPNLWGNQSSGISLPDDVGAALERLVKRDPIPQDSEERPGPDGNYGRLPVEELEQVQADHVLEAVQRVLAGESGDFEDSTTYDIVLEDGSRLPPKKVFGIAAKLALGYEIQPYQFTGGEDSPCFRILREAGYSIVAKIDGSTQGAKPAEPTPTIIPVTSEDREWTEGRPRLVKHLRRERGAGIAKAKKARYRRENGGKLACERCGLQPATVYGEPNGDACIEVHHAKPVSQMKDGDRTRLEDLLCLCANCHRIEHFRLRILDKELDPA